MEDFKPPPIDPLLMAALASEHTLPVAAEHASAPQEGQRLEHLKVIWAPLKEGFERRSSSEEAQVVTAHLGAVDPGSLQGWVRSHRQRKASVHSETPAPPLTPSEPLRAAPPARYGTSPLGDLIGSGEGDYGSFNRGRAGDSPGERLDPETTSLREIMRRQALPPGNQDRWFAVGKYQIIPSTLALAVNELKLDVDQPFTPSLQEMIFAEYLISAKRPQIRAYISGASNRLHSAQLALAREFASVANPNTGRSYYAGSGGNRASISSRQAADALRAMREQYQSFRESGLNEDAAWHALFAVGGMNPDGPPRTSLRPVPRPTHGAEAETAPTKEPSGSDPPADPKEPSGPGLPWIIPVPGHRRWDG